MVDAAFRHSGGTWDLPGRQIPMAPAIAQVQTVRAIEAALLEAKKPPNPWALAVSLASPLVLLGKGLQDLVGSFAQKTAETKAAAATYEINDAKLALALVCMGIGVGALVAAFMHWRRDARVARLYSLAYDHVCDLLRQTGEEPKSS